MRLHKKKPWKIGVFLLTLVMTLSMMGVIPTMASDTGVADLSLNQRSSELARIFGTAISPGAKPAMSSIWNNDPANISGGNAGGLLGKAGYMADDKGVVGWILSNVTANSGSISYEQLNNLVPGSSSDVRDNGFVQYGAYGEALTRMGLAKMGRSSGFRGITTGIVIMVYAMANIAPFIFKMSLTFLDWFNPFRLVDSVLGIFEDSGLPFLQSVSKTVGDIYATITAISMTILFPLMLILVVLSILMFKKGGAGKKVTRYVVRLFMLFAGLPLIGATYTGVINQMVDATTGGAVYADYFVYSSYLDFEGWVTHSRLSPIGDISNPRVLGVSSTLSDSTISAPSRNLILTINASRAGHPSAGTLLSSYDSGNWEKIFGTNEAGERQGTPTTTEQNFRRVMNLLNRHSTSTYYSASDYNGLVSSDYQKMRNNPSEGLEAFDRNLVRMFSLSDNDNRNWTSKIFGGEEELAPVDWTKSSGLFTPGAAVDADFKFGSMLATNIYNAGSLTMDTSGQFTDGTLGENAVLVRRKVNESGGLSPLAMYNFLNTKFTTTGLTVYEPEKTQSDLSRDRYYSVVFVGSGIGSVMRWLETVTVMFCLAVMSIYFGFVTINIAVSNLPRILSSIFGTALGSIAFTTKLLIGVGVMILQMLGLMFFYLLAENIVMAVIVNINNLADMMAPGFIQPFGMNITLPAGSALGNFTTSFLTIALTVFLTFTMMKNVKTLKNLIEEFASGAITRVMNLLDSSTGGQGLDLSKMTNGRIGRDGALTAEAKDKDNRGLFGAAGILSDAADIERKREALRRDNEKDYQPRTAKQKLKAYTQTAGHLAAAAARDKQREVFGSPFISDKKGVHYSDELESEMKQLEAMRMHPDTPLAEAGKRKMYGLNAGGREMDADGNPIITDMGTGINAYGQPISAEEPLGLAGNKPMSDSNGYLLNQSGDIYTDEMGGAFKADAKGKLVNDDGEYVALDADGTLQKLTDLPDHDGKPVNAAKEAKKLDHMRQNAEAFARMQEAQASGTYGLSTGGVPLDKKGRPMLYTDSEGQLQTASINDKGELVGTDGVRIPPKQLHGKIDSRGFKEVTDKKTGETYLQHRGDPAHRGKTAGASAPQTLNGLAREHAKAERQAVMARSHVDHLKASGASQHTIAQAENHAKRVENQAKRAQSLYRQELASGGRMSGAEPVSRESVQAAASYEKEVASQYMAERQVLNQMSLRGASKDTIEAQTQTVAKQMKTHTGNVDKLSQLRATGAPREAILKQEDLVAKSQMDLASNQAKLDTMKKPAARESDIKNQKKRVAVAQAEMTKASTAAMIMQTAQNAGRSYSEVSRAYGVLDNHQQAYATAQVAYAKAEAAGVPKNELRQLSQQVDQAAVEVTRAQNAYDQVKRPPSGNAVTMDQVKSRATHASTHLMKAQRALNQAQRTGNDAEIKAATTQYSQAKALAEKTQRDMAKAVAPVQAAGDVMPEIQKVPSVPISASYAALATYGASTYGSYSQQSKAATEAWQTAQTAVNTSHKRWSEAVRNGAPAPEIRRAKARVQEAEKALEVIQTKREDLRAHAQGLLKSGGFQPSVASKPVRINGQQAINTMVKMTNNQALIEKMEYQAQKGLLPSGDAQRLELMKAQTNRMKLDLTKAGFREDLLSSSSQIKETVKAFSKDWNKFLDGDYV